MLTNWRQAAPGTDIKAQWGSGAGPDRLVNGRISKPIREELTRTRPRSFLTGLMPLYLYPRLTTDTESREGGCSGRKCGSFVTRYSSTPLKGRGRLISMVLASIKDLCKRTIPRPILIRSTGAISALLLSGGKSNEGSAIHSSKVYTSLGAHTHAYTHLTTSALIHIK